MPSDRPQGAGRKADATETPGTRRKRKLSLVRKPGPKRAVWSKKKKHQLPAAEMALGSRERGPPSGVQRPLSARTPTSAAGRRSDTRQRRRPSSRCIAVCQAARTATRGICGHTTLLSPRAPPLGKPPPRSSCRRQTARLCLQRGACPFRRRPCSALHLDKAGFEDESTPYRGSPR